MCGSIIRKWIKAFNETSIKVWPSCCTVLLAIFFDDDLKQKAHVNFLWEQTVYNFDPFWAGRTQLKNYVLSQHSSHYVIWLRTTVSLFSLHLMLNDYHLFFFSFKAVNLPSNNGNWEKKCSTRKSYYTLIQFYVVWAVQQPQNSLRKYK